MKTYLPQRHVMHQNFVATAEFKGIKNAKEDVSENGRLTTATKTVIMALMKLIMITMGPITITSSDEKGNN